MRLRDVATDLFSPRPQKQRNAAPRPTSQQHHAPYRPPSPSTLDDLSDLYESAKAKLTGKMREIDPLIDAYTHMPEMPNGEYALNTLRKIASCVKPIMRKRGWHVGTLSEFYPDQRNLLGLNVNRGQQILIRLRYPHNSNSFLPFEHALDTMLHELCHIQIGPHDQHFHALWQELRDEWDALSLKGYTGEGFLGKGRQLGGSIIPRDEMRRQARAEGARRNKERKTLQKPGFRLGGSRPVPGSSIHDAIAGAAIQRNPSSTQTVTEGCGTGTKAGAQAAADALLNGFRTKEDMDEANALAIQQATMELMTMDEERRLDEQPSFQPPVQQPMSDGLIWDPVNGLQDATSPLVPSTSAPPQSHYHPAPIPHHSRPISQNPVPFSPQIQRPVETNQYGKPLSRLVKEAESKKRTKSSNLQHSSSTRSGSSKTWQCQICTLINESDVSRCAACEVERSSDPPRSASVPVTVQPTPAASSLRPNKSFISSIGWACQWCGNYMDNEWWTCNICGKMKTTS